MINLRDLQCVRNKQGIYFLYDENKELIYIGQSKNIYIRILEHKFENCKPFYFYKAVEINDNDFIELFEVYLIGLYFNTHNLLNKLVIKFDFENFFLNIPSSIRIKYTYNTFLTYHNEIELFISSKDKFNTLYLSEKMKDKLLMDILNER